MRRFWSAVTCHRFLDIDLSMSFSSEDLTSQAFRKAVTSHRTPKQEFF